MAEENTQAQQTPTEVTLTKEESASLLSSTAEISTEILVNTMRIIEAAQKRGAFAASEASSVGKVYDTLTDLVKKQVENVKGSSGAKLDPIPE